MSTKFKLLGLTMNNLLAFLTLLGLLKTLERSKSEWNSQISWKGTSPYLYVSENDVKKDQVIEAIINGLKSFGKEMKFKTHGVLELNKVDVEKFKKLHDGMDTELVAALGSDGSRTKKDKTILSHTPLCLLLGAGHQNFLERLEGTTIINDSDIENEINEALFNSWDDIKKGKGKKNDKITFRWSPKEYRPHAYRAINPSDDPIIPINGANRLAAIGFRLYSCVPTNYGLDTMSYHKQNNEECLIWPIWNTRMTLATIRILMRHPNMKKIVNAKNEQYNKIIKEFQSYGVERIMKARIFWDNKFKNVSLAERIG